MEAPRKIVLNLNLNLLLRDEDCLTVRINVPEEDLPVEAEYVVKKKKRKHEKTAEEHGEIKKPKKKKRKHKYSDDEPGISNIAMETDITKTSETKVTTAVQPVKPILDTREAADSVQEDTNNESMASDTSTTDKLNADGKPKRRRRRKHKRRKNAVKEGSGDATPENKPNEMQKHKYVGNSVQQNETFYGCLPDKLEPPKHYRHGYRNKNTYNAHPNSHKTFDSDSEPEEGSMQQFNFLSKARNQDGILNCVNGDDGNGTNTNDFPLNSDDGASSVNSTSLKHNGHFPERQEIAKPSITLQNQTAIMNDAITEPVGTDNDYVTSWSHINHFNSSPAQSPSTRTSIISPKAESYTSAGASPTSVASPTLLVRKTLSNGASVFCRQRRTPQKGGFRELSKQEQLDDTATNVSTIFTNHKESEFKVPISPVQGRKSMMDNQPKTKSQSPACDAVLHKPRAFITPATSVMTATTDFAKLPPLQGLPVVGQNIAYKVLEISASCTPEVSDFKVAVVMKVDEDQMVELKNISQTQTGPNKFHVEIDDDGEILTNTQEPQQFVTLHLGSLLDARIMT